MQQAWIEMIFVRLSILPLPRPRIKFCLFRGDPRVSIQRVFSPVVCLAFMILPGTLFAREKLAPADVPQFLKNFNSNFSMLDSLYREVSEDQLPLRDEYGKLLGRRPIEDRRQALSELRQNALRLAADPEDLIQTSTLIFKTENLADDLYDLAQIAYDNGLEDLGKRLSDFQITMDHNKDLLGDYLLALAAQKQDHLARLENEKSELEAKIRDAEKQKK